MNNTVENKEIYWSRFAQDFEERNDYVVGPGTMLHLHRYFSSQHSWGKTLELGCGNGTYSKMIQLATTHLTATDFSEEMVENTRLRLKNFSEIEVHQENCFNISHEKESFYTIFMANLLHIIPNPKEALEECKRVLKPQGQIIILSFTTQGMSFFNKVKMIFRYLKTYGKPSETAQTLTIQKAKNLLGDCGFKTQTERLLGKETKAIFIKANLKKNQ